jgi:hypothetical protein
LAKVRDQTAITHLCGVDPLSKATECGKTAYGLDLRVGSASDIRSGGLFDVVILGFCFYLVDMALLPRMVSEVDSRVGSGGSLIIIDCDPPNSC